MTLTGVLAPAVPLQAQPVMWPLALPQLMTAAPAVLACHMPAISGFRRGEKTTPDRKWCLSRSCDGMSLDTASCSLSARSNHHRRRRSRQSSFSAWLQR